jgi:hypothetical protein
MSMFPKLEELDVDGAIREAASKVDGDTRGAFLKKAGIGAGAVLAGGAFAGAIPGIASAGTAKSDVAILNFALTLEYLEAAFYAEAVSKGKFRGKTGAFAKVVSQHENAHVAFLKSALGSAAVKSPKFDFKGTTTDQAKFMATSQVLEDTGVAAYLGQAGNIKSKEILAAALAIHTIEARHAATLQFITNESPTPDGAFSKPMTMAQVLAAVKPFIA